MHENSQFFIFIQPLDNGSDFEPLVYSSIRFSFQTYCSIFPATMDFTCWTFFFL